MKTSSPSISKELSSIRNELTSLSDKTDFLNLIQRISDKVLTHHLGYILALDYQEKLLSLFEGFIARPSD